MCAFWLADALANVGELEEAERRLSDCSVSPRRSVSSQKRSIPGQECCWAIIPRRSATWP